MSRLARLLADTVRRHPERLLPERSAALREILGGGDVYAILGAPSVAVRRLIRSRFGSDMVRALERVHQRFEVSEEVVALYLRWTRERRIAMTYRELRDLLRRTQSDTVMGGLGRLLHADHVIEQRLHRMIRDGLSAHAARTPDAARRASRHSVDEVREQIDDSFALLVPSNEVSAYRIGRALQELEGIEPWALWFYPHLGRGSKTSRMSEFIPYRLEGAYSYQEILNATIWVTMREFPMPRQYASIIRADLIESILVAVSEDPAIAQHVLNQIRRRTGQRLAASNEDAIQAALQRVLTANTSLAADFPKRWRWQEPLESRFQIPDDAVEHGLR